MRYAIAIIASPLAVFAQLSASATGSTNLVYSSNVATNNAWEKHVVTATGPDYSILRDKAGKFASVAEIAAAYEVTEHIDDVEQGWADGFERGCAELREKMSHTPTNGIMIGLQFQLPQSHPRNALEIYVAGHMYSEGYDYLFVHFSNPLSVKPVMEVPYVWNGGFTTNRVGGSWSFGNSTWTNVYTVSQNEIAYTNCHIMRVKRPAALLGVPCNLNPHGLFGRHGDGVTWGNIVLTVNGQPTFTGILTNTTDNTFMQISNGAILLPGIQEVVNE